MLLWRSGSGVGWVGFQQCLKRLGFLCRSQHKSTLTTIVCDQSGWLRHKLPKKSSLLFRPSYTCMAYPSPENITALHDLAIPGATGTPWPREKVVSLGWAWVVWCWPSFAGLRKRCKWQQPHPTCLTPRDIATAPYKWGEGNLNKGACYWTVEWSTRL